MVQPYRSLCWFHLGYTYRNLLRFYLQHCTIDQLV
jgi:hypothetical protein